MRQNATEGRDDMRGVVVLPGWGDEREATPREQLLSDRVAALEERLEQMRTSRRVLMRLWERAEQEKRVQVDNLRRENARLRRQNGHLARLIWEEKICHR